MGKQRNKRKLQRHPMNDKILKDITLSSPPHALSHPLQEIARGEGQGVSDSINLDVHAIAELKEKGVPPTNDMFKYNYVADDKGSYSEFDRVVITLW